MQTKSFLSFLRDTRSVSVARVPTQYQKSDVSRRSQSRHKALATQWFGVVGSSGSFGHHFTLGQIEDATGPRRKQYFIKVTIGAIQVR